MPVKLQQLSIRLPADVVKTLDDIVARQASLNSQTRPPIWPGVRNRSQLIRHILLHDRKYIDHIHRLSIRKDPPSRLRLTPHPTISHAAATD